MYVADGLHYDSESLEECGFPLAALDGDFSASSRRRKLTDAWVLPPVGILLTVAIIGLGGAMRRSDTARLDRPFDFQGLACAVDTPTRPFLFWPRNPKTKEVDPRTPLCVGKCFTSEDVDAGATVGYPNVTALATQSLDHGEAVQVEIHYVDSPVYATKEVGGQYCVPEDESERSIASLFRAAGAPRVWSSFSRGIVTARKFFHWFIISGFVALGASVGLVLLLKHFAVTLSVGALVLGPVSLTISGCGFITAASTQRIFLLARVAGIGTGASIGFGCLLLVVCAVNLILLWGMRHSILGVIAVVNAAGKCLASITSVLFAPLMAWTAITLLAYSGIRFLSSVAASTASHKTPFLTAIGVIGSQNESGWSWRGVVACLCLLCLVVWVAECILAFVEFLVTYATCRWYFSLPDVSGRRAEEAFSLVEATRVTIRYHLGTVFIAATFMSAFKATTCILKLLNRHGRSPVSGFIDVLITSCQKVVDNISHCGFAECALHSTGFFVSNRTAIETMRCYIPSVMILHGTTRFISSSVVALISSSSAGLAYTVLTRVPRFSDPESTSLVTSPMALCLFVFVSSAAATRLVMTTFDQVADTLLYCFLVETREGKDVIFSPDAIHSLIEEHQLMHRLKETSRATPSTSTPPDLREQLECLSFND